MTVFQRYAAALLPLLVTVVGAYQVALAGGVSPQELLQLAILTLGLANSFYAKLLDIQWAGVLKTGGNILAAILTALVPLVAGGWDPAVLLDPNNSILVILAALNALATEVGVQIRIDPVVAQAVRGLPPQR